MRVLSKESSRDINEIIDLAIGYFNGLFGLPVIEHIPNCCAEFRKDDSYVTIQIVPNVTSNEVIMTTQKWDQQIHDFIQGL